MRLDPEGLASLLLWQTHRGDNFMKSLTTVLVFLLSQIALADPTVAYQADLKMSPAGPHKDGVVWQLQAIKDNDVLNQVKVITDKPVFGKKEFVSSDLAIKLIDLPNGEKQFGAAFKLKSTPHPFHMLYLAVSNDGGATFSGRFFRVSGRTIADFETMLGAPVVLDPLPDGFKMIAEGVLKKL